MHDFADKLSITHSGGGGLAGSPGAGGYIRVRVDLDDMYPAVVVHTHIHPGIGAAAEEAEDFQDHSDNGAPLGRGNIGRADSFGGVKIGAVLVPFGVEGKHPGQVIREVKFHFGDR